MEDAAHEFPEHGMICVTCGIKIKRDDGYSYAVRVHENGTTCEPMHLNCATQVLDTENMRRLETLDGLFLNAYERERLIFRLKSRQYANDAEFWQGVSEVTGGRVQPPVG